MFLRLSRTVGFNRGLKMYRLVLCVCVFLFPFSFLVGGFPCLMDFCYFPVNPIACVILSGLEGFYYYFFLFSFYENFLFVSFFSIELLLSSFSALLVQCPIELHIILVQCFLCFLPFYIHFGLKIHLPLLILSAIAGW